MARILVADDAPFFRTMLQDVLKIDGHELIFAEDGEMAVALAQQEAGKIDLIILDMVLPKKTGLEVLMDISDLKIPTVCVTGSDQVTEINELRELGAIDVINKSLPIEQVFHRIHTILHEITHSEETRVRKNKRIVLQLQIEYRTHTAAYTSNTFTLSEQGVFIQTDSPLPKDTEIDLGFYLPSQKQIDCHAKVLYSEMEGKPGKPKGMGIFFQDLSAFDLQLIRDFIDQQPG